MSTDAIPINCVPMLIAYVDINRVYRYVNTAYCEKLSLSAEEVNGRPIKDVVDSETWEQKRLHLDRVFAGETVTAELRRTFASHGTPHETWILGHYVPDRDDLGHVRGCFVAMSDITELKELLAAKERQVEQRDLFLATLSHELRNPLGAVTSALQLLQRAEDNTELQKKTLAAIGRQATQMTALLDDLLEVARVTKGKIELRKVPVCLSDIVRESVESVMPIFDKRNQAIQCELGTTPVWVDGDNVRLRQIVMNLLTNASRYSAPGESVIVSMDPRSQAESKKCSMVAVHVKDHGIGIPKEMQERVFEPFAQLRRTHNEASEGLGLGLSLSRHLAELHGGSVTVFSEGEGCGSIFTILLPVIDAPAASLFDQTPSGTLDVRSLSIVLIEDHDDAREVLRQLLELEHFQVQTAADGPSGWELVRRVRPQVALIDIGLPGMNGHEIARSARLAGLPTFLIAITGYGQDSDRQAALAAGFDEHVTKPLKFDELLNVLNRAATNHPTNA